MRSRSRQLGKGPVVLRGGSGAAAAATGSCDAGSSAAATLRPSWLRMLKVATALAVSKQSKRMPCSANACIDERQRKRRSARQASAAGNARNTRAATGKSRAFASSGGGRTSFLPQPSTSKSGRCLNSSSGASLQRMQRTREHEVQIAR